MSDDERHEALMKLVQDLNTNLCRTLESHSAELQRLNENLIAAHKLTENHESRIRENLEALGILKQLLDKQSQSFNLTREALIKLWEDRFGIDVTIQVPSPIH